MAFVWGLLHYLLLALATWYESKIWFRGFDIHRSSSWKYWLRLRLVGSSTLFDPLISRLGSSIQIRLLPQNTNPLLFSYSPPDLLWTNRKIFQTKTSCYDSEFCQRLPSSLLFSYSPCLEQTTKDFKQKHIFLPQNTNPLILIFLPCLSVNPKEKEIKLKSLCPEMLFFFTVIEPSTEREREFKQIQSEILTSYIWYPLLLTLPIGFLRIRLKEVTYLEPPANPKCNTVRNELCCSRGNQTKTIAFSLSKCWYRGPQWSQTKKPIVCKTLTGHKKWHKTESQIPNALNVKGTFWWWHSRLVIEFSIHIKVTQFPRGNRLILVQGGLSF